MQFQRPLCLHNNPARLAPTTCGAYQSSACRHLMHQPQSLPQYQQQLLLQADCDNLVHKQPFEQQYQPAARAQYLPASQAAIQHDLQRQHYELPALATASYNEQQYLDSAPAGVRSRVSSVSNNQQQLASPASSPSSSCFSPHSSSFSSSSADLCYLQPPASQSHTGNELPANNHFPLNLDQYISKRNERERSRVRNVNDAFDNLKNSLPLRMERLNKRMSKVEILRSAISYIRRLEDVLYTMDQLPESLVHDGSNNSDQQRDFQSIDYQNNNNDNDNDNTNTFAAKTAT